MLLSCTESFWDLLKMKILSISISDMAELDPNRLTVPHITTINSEQNTKKKLPQVSEE